MSKRKHSNYFSLLLLGSCLFLGGLITYVLSVYYFSQTEFTCVVEEKTITETHGMRVFTECGDYAIGDVPFRTSQDPQEIYDFLIPGQEYDFMTVGYRVPAMNFYPYILEVR